MAATRRKRAREAVRAGDRPVTMNQLTVSPARLAQLRKICLALPDATEKVAWGDPTWRVRGRIFAMQKGNVEVHRPSLWLEAPAGAQEMLVAGDAAVFFVPPYVGKNGWIGIYLDGRALDWTMLRHLIEDSHRLIASPSGRKRRDT